MLSLTPGILADIMEQMHKRPSLDLLVGLPSECIGEADRPLPAAYLRGGG